MKKTKRLFHIDLHYACFGIESENGVVIAAAPIARWMVGKTLQEIKPFLIAKKARVLEVEKDLEE